MENKNNISCPKCGTEINVSQILYNQVQEQLKKDFESKNAEKDIEIQKKQRALDAYKEQLLKEKENVKEQIEKEVKAKIITEKLKLENEIKSALKEETSEQINLLKKELDEKSGQVKDLNKTKAEIEKLKREKDELRDLITLEKEKEFSEKLKDLNKTKAEIEKLKREKDELRDLIVLEKEKEFSEKLKEEKLKIQKQVDENSTLKIMELEKQLKDQKQLAEEMKRKAEQGSMQLQGEVQELAIEDTLKSMFPFDEISEVAKGVKGADVVHTVKNKSGNNCGKILYESKRTKVFTNEWINKLKIDALAEKADICIIVTEALPDGVERIGQKDGVWICTFNDFKGLVLVLRESLIKINEAYSSQTNKGEKMQMLYDYLTSTEFRLQIGAIIEGFTDLQNSYTQEKRAMERIWKQREKQLEKVLLNTNHFIGSIKGIAGSSIPDLKQIGDGDNILELE